MQYKNIMKIQRITSMFSNKQGLYQRRIQLNEEIFERFFKKIVKGKVYELAKDKGLSYTLVYNLAHRRIKSLSARDYRIIFGEDPPYQEKSRVDGAYFRGMVRLWSFLNDDATQAGLYREFYPDKKSKKVDYRMFGGDVNTVTARLEKMMERKFLDQGVDKFEIKDWIEDLNLIENKERVSYEVIRPVLDFLERNLEVNPSHILNQSSARYESGELITVSKKIYDYALKLKARTEGALSSGLRFEIEKLREEIYGKRDGLTLFSEVEAELDFLQSCGGKSSKKYLGRSIGNYKKSKLKRIASWRAQRIKDDCNEFIKNEQPSIPLLSVPGACMRMRLAKLLSILKSYTITKLIEDKNETYERDMLTPNTHGWREYESEKDGYTRMDHASSVLGMSKKAFDLMVAAHSDIFRKIGTYEKGWFLPDLYLAEIIENEGFYIIKAKYELLAKGDRNVLRPDEGAGQSACVSERDISESVVSHDHEDAIKHMHNTTGKETFISRDSYINFQHTAIDLM
jgi:hypothetical protein